ncbi:MAG: hypothetical protein LBN20_04805 [Endomicrobium sp.]|nr:hypothetical protein [Endomicrobium sp.]
MKEFCGKIGACHYKFSNKQKVTDFLASIELKSLIISASNLYIFPSCIVTKTNFKIINYHNALLPSYPGRNAESWVIFNQEKKTGITWHEVSAEIDAGGVIIQETIPITDDAKAYELFQQCFVIGHKCFEKIIGDILIDKYMSIVPQIKEEGRKIYLSSEIPNNGLFDLTMYPSDIYRLLRSMDYAGLPIMPLLKTRLFGQEYEICKYSKIPHIVSQEELLTISVVDEKEDKVEVCMKYNDTYDLKIMMQR